MKRKTRRGGGNKAACHDFSVIGNNANGINSKLESLEHVLKYFKGPSCVLIQETKIRGSLRKKIPGYQIFQKPASADNSGGLMTAIRHDLSPIEQDCNVTMDILVVEVLVDNLRIRIINAYGPQEYDKKEKKTTFGMNWNVKLLRLKITIVSYLLKWMQTGKLDQTL